MIAKCTERTPGIVNELMILWEKSVQASHDFLSGEDIEALKPFAKTAIEEIPELLISWDGETAKGFIGIDDHKIEMLFITPECFGKGIGKQLISIAISEYNAGLVDVNEQNPKAKEFYERLGFSVYKRSDFDDFGKPFPIFHMKL